MATITIKYTAPVAPTTQVVAPICRCFYPANCAADHPNVAGTYYDTNVEGWGEGTSLEEFIAKSVHHPGLCAALKQAVYNDAHEYTINEADEKTKLYIYEVAGCLKTQGFTFLVDGVDVAPTGTAPWELDKNEEAADSDTPVDGEPETPETSVDGETQEPEPTE